MVDMQLCRLLGWFPSRHIDQAWASEQPDAKFPYRAFDASASQNGVYPWEFDKDQQSLTVAVNGPLVVDDVELMIRAAIDGTGLAFMSDDRAGSGTLYPGARKWVSAVHWLLSVKPSFRRITKQCSSTTLNETWQWVIFISVDKRLG